MDGESYFSNGLLKGRKGEDKQLLALRNSRVAEKEGKPLLVKRV